MNTVTGAHVLITGGAGFIGSNLAAQLAQNRNKVRVFDNLSREGVRRNADWLQRRFPERIELIVGDIRDAEAVRQAADGVEFIFHLAAQVAVTTSVTDPRTDFEVNALGTFNLLEAARSLATPPVVLFTSTNKVYGGMDDLSIVERDGRYAYADLPTGVPETRCLDFHSPYGCSKGTGDQYVRDYHRIYGIPTVVFRMSCIYGPRQFGNEDQGWVAHFARAMMCGEGLTIYGDGKQVRDVLFVEDLVQAMLAAAASNSVTRGEVFNIGGGSQNTLSLLELIAALEERLGRKAALTFAPWRPGDQRVYISDPTKALRVFGWQPTTSVPEGVARLLDWLRTDEASL